MTTVRDAILLVGGHGSRMKPLTDSRPKHLLPVGGVPLLDLQLRRLRELGVHRVCLATARHADLISAHVDALDLRNLDVRISTEVSPLGTGGGLLAALDLLAPGDAPVAVLNGDLLTGHDLRRQAASLRPCDDVVLHVRPVDDPSPFGTVDTDADGMTVTGFREKTPGPAGTLVNAGTYIVRPAALAAVPRGAELSWEREVLPTLIDAGIRVRAHREDAWFADIGSPAALVGANAAVLDGTALSALPADYDPRYAVATDVVTAPRADVQGTSLGPGCRVGSDSQVLDSVLLPHVVVGSRAEVHGSVLGERVVVGDGVVLTGCAVADGVVLTAGSVHEGSRIR